MLKRYIFPAIFISSFLIFLAHTAYTKTAVFADAKFYFATTRSIIKDGDLKFTNEFISLGIKPTITHKDYVWNMYPPGVSLFWVPLYLTVDSLNIPFRLLSVDTAGYGLPYQTSAALTNIFLGTLGLVLLHRLLSSFFSKDVSFLTTLTLFLTTNLFFYIAVEPINSHAVSFFVSSLFIYYFLKHKSDRRYYLILGLIAGVAGLIRTQDSLLLALPAIGLIARKKSLQFQIRKYLVLAFGYLISFSPQIIFWKRIFDTFWYSPYLNVGFNFLKPQIIHVLFNTQNGLFAITPAVAFAFIGLMINLKHNNLKKVSFFSITYFLLQLYLVSSWSNFFQGGSYSIRMMVTSLPFLSFGLAKIIEYLDKNIGGFKTYAIATIFSILNFSLILRYLLSY
jgi:hypothetical protein